MYKTKCCFLVIITNISPNLDQCKKIYFLQVRAHSIDNYVYQLLGWAGHTTQGQFAANAK